MRKTHPNSGAEIRSFPTSRRADAPAASKEAEHRAGGSSAVALTGTDAVELYVAEIDRNFDALDAQLALLREAFTERQRLLDTSSADASAGSAALDDVLWFVPTTAAASGK